MKKYILFSFLLFVLVSMNAQNTSGLLTVTATTSTVYGTYAPKNVVAMWIQDSSGKFVKTMLILANARKAHLTNWVTATPVGNSIDAITGATQSSHGTRACTWKATDLAGVVVPDGTYTVIMEMTESNTGSKLGTFTFVKGPNGVTLTPANILSFGNISIQWAPTIAGLEDVKLASLYNVYPNPANSSIFVNGIDINEVEIFSLSAKSLLKTKDQSINISSLARGTYLVQIQSKLGMVVKKLVKE
ncbi:MAG: DUF2271 domain-containing protein [Paludibacter sp.]|jgi:hypothetical protein